MEGDADWLDLEFLADHDRRCQRCGSLLGPDMVFGVGVEIRLIELKTVEVEGPQAVVQARCDQCGSRLAFDSVMDKERLLSAIARVWDELDERVRQKAESLGVTRGVMTDRACRVLERIRTNVTRATPPSQNQ